MRTDTTVTEANIHHQTDSTLLADGVRVLQRSLERISEQCATGAVQVVDHARAVKHRLLEIDRAAKSFAKSSGERMADSYRKLLRLTRGVVDQATAVSQELLHGGLEVVGSARRVVIESMKLDHFVPLVQRVIEQTHARVFTEDRHFAGKIVSLFEEHAQVIRKGKVHKPTEFGRLVRVDQVENGIVSNFAVADGNPGDSTQWETALQGHQQRYGRVPGMATGDRGFYSAANEKTAREMGVKRVALPARGKLSQRRRAYQKQRWFRRALRWRGGIEPAIATLKHRFAMARAFYKGDRGFKRAVGWSVIANNLVMIARFQRRQEHNHKQATA
jgi:IS5 family transposase